MIEKDTVRLLRECDAGIKMGIDSMEDMMKYVNSESLCKTMKTSCEEHKKLQEEVEGLLGRYHDDGKDPNPMVKGMSWVMTNVKLIMKESDAAIADMVTDGCNMGVKSLSRYLNQYAAADEKSKDIAKRLIQLESQLAVDVRGYL